jgi:hypothetical protein
MGETTDSYFNVQSSNGTHRTEIRRKRNNTSIYLNLENSSGGTATVQILRGDGQRCATNDRRHVVQLGKKYMLYNDVNENGATHVQLSLTTGRSTTFNGCWSPDSVPESGCSILQ